MQRVMSEGSVVILGVVHFDQLHCKGGKRKLRTANNEEDKASWIASSRGPLIERTDKMLLLLPISSATYLKCRRRWKSFLTRCL